MIPALSAVRLSEPGPPAKPLLILGPSLGTSATTLWSQCALALPDCDVVAWDLPGHGSSPRAVQPFSIPDVAAAVHALIVSELDSRGTPDARWYYAGDSFGGAVGLQLLLSHPQRLGAAVLLCTGARIGTPDGWRERAATVRASGTPVMVGPSAARWFSPGFLDRHPETGAALLQALHDTDTDSYAWACEALADFDVRDRLAEITAPVLAVAGADDQATTETDLGFIASGTGGRLIVLNRVAHQAPAEAPKEVARLITSHLRTTFDAERTAREIRSAGMAVRREVLGDAHVANATAAATDLTREFQDFITQYAWGTIWTRPGLDRRSRSLITLTALVARGHHEELALHLRAARTNGVTEDEIKELLLQTAIYCGVPDANTAFRIAQLVVAARGDDASETHPEQREGTQS